MYFSDPAMCTRCQNHGYHEYLNGKVCHRCEIRRMIDACITVNVKKDNLSLALTQMRFIGI